VAEVSLYREFLLIRSDIILFFQQEAASLLVITIVVCDLTDSAKLSEIKLTFGTKRKIDFSFYSKSIRGLFGDATKASVSVCN
jgi:hypothetical protein